MVMEPRQPHFFWGCTQYIFMLVYTVATVMAMKAVGRQARLEHSGRSTPDPLRSTNAG